MENTTDEKIFKAVCDVLADVYDDNEIPQEDLLGFAGELTDAVFKDECNLTDILCMALCFEEQLRADGIKIDDRSGGVYIGILGLLELNRNNAKRIYDSFTEYRDLTAFYALMDDYAELLTEEEIQDVLEMAQETFIEYVWKDYV